MALTDDGTNTTMLVSPAGFGGNNGGFGDGNGWWIILLIILLVAGGTWGGNNGNNAPYVPYAVDNSIQTGFNQASIVGGLGNIQNAITSGFASAEVADNARQMANMQQMFALSTQLGNCCCENRLATANLQSTIQSENCADRAVISDGVRDILTASNANTQKILDVICQNTIDAKNEKIASLERELTMANLASSQTAQTARLLADNSAQTTALEQYLNPVPVPAYIVQNPRGCSCGCGSF